MEQEYTQTNQTLHSTRPLSLPHFDDEATLLSARPVVPLNEVKAERSSTRRLVLAFSVVAALLVGALGATMLYAHRYRLQASVSAETAQSPSRVAAPKDSVSPSGEMGGSSIGSNQMPAFVTRRGETSNSRVARDSGTPTAATRTAAPTLTRVAKSSRPVVVLRNKNEELLEDERQLRRAERQEDRRLKREAARDRRRGVSDDLLRIREIFEGSPRP